MNAETKKEQIELAWELHEDEVYPFGHPLEGRIQGCCLDCDWGGECPIMKMLWNDEIDWLQSIGVHDMTYHDTPEDIIVAWMFSSDFYKKSEETEADLNLPVASFQP